MFHLAGKAMSAIRSNALPVNEERLGATPSDQHGDKPA